jgi:large-conductance mechanosensitive channel
MVSITSDLYFTNIHILPSAINAKVCKNWYANIICILKKKKQTFYELQIYNLIINKYSSYPPIEYNVRRRLDFGDKNYNIFDNNIFDIAYDNMIKQIFNYLKKDTIVFLNIKESLISYYTKYTDIYKKYSRMELLEISDSGYIDKNIANEYKEILLKHYNHIIT